MTYVDSLNSNALPPLVVGRTADSIVIGVERSGDAQAREALLDRAFGPGRFRKTCQKLRAGRLPAQGLCLAARLDRQELGRQEQDGHEIGNDELVGTLRLWHVMAGGVPALMLGPLAVDDRLRAHGIGARLMDEAITRAKAFGHQAILLVGDASYYARFGFARRHTLALRMPGPVDDDRFLGLELRPDALALANGMVRGTGAVDIASPLPSSLMTYVKKVA